MKKKGLSILLCAAMSAALLAGCGDVESSQSGEAKNPNSSKEENVTLRVAFWGNQTRIDRMTEAMNLYMEQNENITIDLQNKPFGDHFTDLASAATTDTMPDLFFMSSAYVATYLEAGKLLELTPYAENGSLDLSNVSESVLSICRDTDGGLY